MNRHSINNLIDAMHTTLQDINNLYNLTTSLAASINFNQMILHIRSVFANLWDSLHYLCSFHTHHGLHRHHHFRHTVTPCSTSCGSTDNAQSHCWHLTPNLAPTNITRGHPAFLQVLTYTCLDREQTVLITDQHSHTGYSLPDHNTSGFYFGYPTWKLLSSLWFQH